MRISIIKLRKEVVNTLIKLGVEEKDSVFIADHYLEAEFEGKTSHGIGRLVWEMQFFKKRQKKPKIIINRGAMAYINGNKEIGPLAARFASTLVIKKAKKYGIGFVGMGNSQQYGALDTWVKLIINENLIGIVMNTCQPAAAAYGGSSKILGTNPISIGIPMNGYPILLDMATSKKPMGLIWEAIRQGTSLPKKTFFDEKGIYTTNPHKAKSVEIFGGYKGYGLSLAIQILTGSLIGMPMGFKIKTELDIGYVFIAINPSFIQSIKQFKLQTAAFIKELKKSNKKIGVKKIIIPGENARENKKANLRKGYLEVDDKIIKILKISKNV